MKKIVTAVGILCGIGMGLLGAGRADAQQNDNKQHVLNLRNTSGVAIEFVNSQFADGRGAWTRLEPGQTIVLTVITGRYLFARRAGDRGWASRIQFPDHPHRQWWWRTDRSFGIVGDPDRVPPNYNGKW